MTEYNILLKAKVDKTSDIQGDVNDLAKSVKLKISKVEIDPAALAAIQEQIAKATRNPKDANAKGMKVGVDFSDASNAMKTLSNDVEKIRGNFSSLGSNVNVTKLFDKDGIRQYSVSVENIANGMKTIDTYGVSIAKNGEQTITSMKGMEKAVTATATSQVSLNSKIEGYQKSLDGIRIAHKDAYKSENVKALDVEVQNLTNSYDGSKQATKNLSNATKDLNNGIAKQESITRTTTNATDNFASSIGKAIGKIALWGVATGLLYGSLKKIQEGIQYIKDLNQEMTNIGMVTGQTTEQLTGTAIEFNNKAKELGATTLDMAQGYVEWARQGRSAADSMILLTNSTMLSKLGNISAADATTKLTSAINAYGISVADSIKVVDVITKLDQEFATSTAEIADAMEESSSMARQAGIEYQNLASYIK